MAFGIVIISGGVRRCCPSILATLTRTKWNNGRERRELQSFVNAQEPWLSGKGPVGRLKGGCSATLPSKRSSICLRYDIWLSRSNADVNWAGRGIPIQLGQSIPGEVWCMLFEFPLSRASVFRSRDHDCQTSFVVWRGHFSWS